MSEDEPDNKLVNCAVSIVQTINVEGQIEYTVRRRGEVPLSTYVGLIELAKMTVIEDFQKEE